MALIFGLSSVPGLHSGLGFDWALRKCAHAAEYFVLTGLLARAFNQTWKLGPAASWFLPAITALAYAVSDEVHQLFVPNRSGSPLDAAIDAAGIAIFYLALRIFSKSKEKT
jgi:VanZ family protein